MSARMDAVVSAVAWEAGLDPDRNSQDKILIYQFINDTRREIYELPTRFSALEFSGEIVGVANVTAGTVSATQNQAEVTGSSTAFSTAMAGRYISINSEPYQRISFVSDSTHLTLESSWNGSTISAKTYKIWKRDYSLPGKVEKVLEVRPLSSPDTPLAYFEHSEFSQRYGFGPTYSDPEVYTQFGTNDLADDYLGSTVFTSVSVTANSPIADFSGAGLVTAMSAGDWVRIGNSTTATAFNVDRVLTDNKILLTTMAGHSASSLSATARALNRTLINFHPMIDSTKVYRFLAKKKLYNLTSSADYIEDGWYSAIKKGAIAKAMGYVNSPREKQKLEEFRGELVNLIRNQYRANNPSIRLKPHIRDRYSDAGIGKSDKDTGYGY